MQHSKRYRNDSQNVDKGKAYALPEADVVEILRDSGLQVRPELTLKEIGAKNGVSPMDIYDAIYQAAAATGVKTP